MIKNIKTALEAKQCQTERGLALLDAINIISGKWKMIIICVIKNNKFRFKEIQELIPTITPRMLSNELKELEANSVVKRTVHNTIPVLIEYSIHESAFELVDIILHLVDWGMKHRENVKNG